MTTKAEPAVQSHDDRPHGLRFEGGEHTYLGNAVRLKLPDGSVRAGDHPLTLKNGLVLTYGQVIALAGDFYSTETPISDNPVARFPLAYATLAEDAKARGEAPQILAVMQREIDEVNVAIGQGRQPSTAYAALGNTLNLEWNVITRDKTNSPFRVYPYGRYFRLAAVNMDHFGADALTCYTAGHKWAQREANEAGQEEDPDLRKALLERAYTINAFADHYLTDLFSAGHLRTPRRELYDMPLSKVLSGLLAKAMHDEDCAYGLRVRNERGDVWHAYGDKRLRDDVDTTNRELVLKAVQASADDVWTAFCGKAPQDSAGPYVPGLTFDPESPVNLSPLFVVVDGVMLRRGDLADRKDYSWTERWHGWSTYLALWSIPEFRDYARDGFVLARDVSIAQLRDDAGKLAVTTYGPGVTGPIAGPRGDAPATNALAHLAVDYEGLGYTDIVSVWQAGEQLAMARYSADETGAYAQRWMTRDVGQGWRNRGFLTVLGRDAKTRIVQLLGADDHALGMITYAPEHGGGYEAKWGNGDLGHPAKHIAMLVLDTEGDGDAEIVQLSDNGGHLGMAVYAPGADEGYALRWSSPHMGIASAHIAFLPADIDGDGSTEIVRLWDNGGVLAADVLAPTAGGGYELRWSAGNLGQRAGAITYLTADVHDDGRTHLVQLWDNAGRLAMAVYEPVKGEGFEHRWYTPDAGGPSSAIGWLMSQPDHGGGTDIVQLRDHDGRLALTVYAPNGDTGQYVKAGDLDDLGPLLPTVRFLPVNLTSAE